MGGLLCSIQMADILSLQICSKLRPSDIQALGQTCTALRDLVSAQLPASTWASVAANALPTAHPLLSLPGTEVQRYLKRIARAKQILPEPMRLGRAQHLLSKPLAPAWLRCVI